MKKSTPFTGNLPSGAVTHSYRHYVREWRRAGKTICAVLNANEKESFVQWKVMGYEPGMSVVPTWQTQSAGRSDHLIQGNNMDLPAIVVRAILALAEAKSVRRGARP